MTAPHITLEWTKITWSPNETIRADLFPKLRAKGLSLHKLRRSVYVIRLNGNFIISYPKSDSPTIYIGEGYFPHRINSHRKWVSELEELVGEFSFEVFIATPRVKNNPEAYRDCEAALLEEFGRLFGSAPLWNKQFERRRNDYTYERKSLKRPLTQGSGTRFKWAIKPIKTCIFCENFKKTHRV